MSQTKKKKATIRVTVSSPVFRQSVIDIVRAELSKKPVETQDSCKRFQKLNDGWIKDSETGLDWGPSSERKMNFVDAQKWCASNGGRLPSVKELFSLLDHGRREPAIDVEFFKDTRHGDYYWTGTKVAGYSGSAWCVFFRFGGVRNGTVDYSYCVRPCRASQ